MYEAGKRVVIRNPDNGTERVVLIEEVVSHTDGQKLRVKDLATGARQLVNPITDNLVEQLED